MSYPKKCCIPGCCSDASVCKLYNFPTSREICMLWKEIVTEKYPSLIFKHDREGRCYQRICCRHFESKYIRDDGSRLFYTIPTLFNSHEIETGVPDQHIQIGFGTGDTDFQNLENAEVAVKRTLNSATHSVNLDHDYGQIKRIRLLKQSGAEPTAPIASTSSTDPGPIRGTPGKSLQRALDAEPTAPIASTSSTDPGPIRGTPGKSLQRALDAEPTAPIASTSSTDPGPIRGTPGKSLQRALDAEPTAPIASTSSTDPGPIRGTPGKSLQGALGRSITTRSRIVKSVEGLTPRCRKMYSKCLGIIKSKKRLIDQFQDRLKDAEDLCKKKSFKSMIDQLPKHVKTFVCMQVNLADKHRKRRRFTVDDKLLALTLLKQSPKGYKLLQKLFILPSRRTLSTFTQEFHMSPGLNSNVLAQLKETVTSWDAIKRACAIAFDEIALTPHLTYVESQDEIMGLVNFGQGSEKRFCDHALVFMVRGICSSWRQMVAFYYCEGTTPALTLKNILRDVVEGVALSGLHPMVLLCDQGSTFQTCLKSFQEDTRREQLLNNESEDGKINIKGHKLNIVYDPPHLIKGIRNNFLTKDLSFCGKTARWNDIVEVYNADCELGEIRMLNKLTDDHIHPNTSQKMKVKTCTQVLSERVSAMLQYSSIRDTHTNGTPTSPTMRTTGEAVLFFDRLFDSVNGSRRGAADRGKLRGPVKDVRGENKHVTFWKDSINTLQNCYFFETSPDGHVTKKWVPTIGNWIVTLKSFIAVWNDLKKIGVTFFYTRNLNQDPLENFFGRVRALNHRSNQPDAYAFQCSFKSLLITNTLGPHSPHSNCEDDLGALLFTLQRNINECAEGVSVAGPSRPNAACEPARPRAPQRVSAPPSGAVSPSGPGGADLLRQARMERTSVHACAFTAGYVSRKLIAKFKCQSCKRSFLCKDPSDLHDWITLRERSLLRGRNLMYPSSAFVMLFRSLIAKINDCVDNYPHRSDIQANIKSEFLETAAINWLGCPQHHSDVVNFFIALVCRLQIHNFCITVNKILKGSHKNINTSFSMHRLALEKRKKISGAKKTSA